MKIYRSFVLLAVSAFAVTSVHAQSDQIVGAPLSSRPSSQSIINEPTSETGSFIKKDPVYGLKFPLNKTYEQLTPEQKADLHAMYDSLPGGDEPPFPLEGLKPVVGAIRKAQAQLKARGELYLAVTVGADGKVKQVADYSSINNPEMTKFAASILLMTKFKPAVCGGAPCVMQFPFNLKLRGG